jgi:ppGpp synthetase/RelA/SpoT-type nucleotidyltranferase
MNREIIKKYEEKYTFYQEFTEKMKSLVERILHKQNIPIHSIVSRTKTKNSLENKIVSAGHKYDRLEKITDLAGIRIITYYEDQIDQVANFIRQEFCVDEENSVDKRKMLAPDRFGYLSLHLIVNLSAERAGLPEYEQFKKCKVEIQIRSILQHAWAEIEHDLEYKNQANVTDETRRHFSRLAGLLEFADLEFEKIRDQIIMSKHYPVLCEAKSTILPMSMKTVSLPRNSRMMKLLDKVSSVGWAASFVAVTFVFSLLLDIYFNSKITHIALILNNLLVHG